MLSYLYQFQPWVEKIVVITHNAKDFNLHFILNRAIPLKRKLGLIMNRLKIMCLRVEHLVFLEYVPFLPFALRKMPEAFGITVVKSWYPHYFNRRANVEYVGKIPDITNYSVDEIMSSERNEFLAWYDGERDEVFDNRRVVEVYSQDDVSVLRQACCVLRREFLV